MTELKDFLSNGIRPIDSRETVANIQDFFAELTYSHFPVVEESIYIGSVSGEDCETFEPHKQLAEYRYTFESFFVRENMIWLDVLETFAKNNTNVVPVLDETNNYIGYYELQDVIKFFNETPFLKEQGGIIVIKKGVLDFSMSQIAQIVESNNGKILGLFISDADATSVEITVKISLGAMNEIIQSFRRYNYEIVSEHQEDNYLNNLKERSDYLDKYLNI